MLRRVGTDDASKTLPGALSTEEPAGDKTQPAAVTLMATSTGSDRATASPLGTGRATHINTSGTGSRFGIVGRVMGVFFGVLAVAIVAWHGKWPLAHSENPPILPPTTPPAPVASSPGLSLFINAGVTNPNIDQLANDISALPVTRATDPETTAPSPEREDWWKRCTAVSNEITTLLDLRQENKIETQTYNERRDKAYATFCALLEEFKNFPTPMTIDERVGIQWTLDYFNPLRAESLRQLDRWGEGVLSSPLAEQMRSLGQIR